MKNRLLKMNTILLLGLIAASSASSPSSARAYHLWYGGGATAIIYSGRSECVSKSYGNPCKVAIEGRFCNGLQLYATNALADSMGKSYARKDKIIVSYIKNNGKFGKRMCFWNL
jgi:hypothetical protein